MRYIGDGVEFFEGPDLVLIGSGLPHYWDCSPSRGYCLQFESHPGSPLAALRESGALKLGRWRLRQKLSLAALRESGTLKPLLQKAARGLAIPFAAKAEILAEFKKMRTSNSLARLAAVVRILERLTRCRTRPLASRRMNLADTGRAAEIEQAVRFLIKNAEDPDLHLQDLLSQIGMSKPTFSRHFQAALGQNFTSFLQSIRLERARRLLTTTNRPVTDIAFASGFGNLSHFNKLFHQRWGATPRQIRDNPEEPRPKS